MAQDNKDNDHIQQYSNGMFIRLIRPASNTVVRFPSASTGIRGTMVAASGDRRSEYLYSEYHFNSQNKMT